MLWLAEHFNEHFAMLCLVPLSNGTYSLQLHGQDKTFIGMELGIQCVVMESGSHVEADDIQVCLAIPNGEVIMVVATMEHNGTYSCIALIDNTSMMVSLSVVVYGKVVIVTIAM